MTAKIIERQELAERADQWRKEGRRLVLTNGCFDLLHVGHVRYLSAARALGDFLVVGVNGDVSVRQLKGADRPINKERDRAEVLAALESVSFVTVFPELRATQLLALVRPNVYVKGGDYTPETLNPEEKAVLDQIGAEIRIIPFESGYSTTRLIQQFESHAP